MTRVPAIDWMRGLVMILMTTDHASKVFFSRHLVSDSAFLHQAGTALDAGAFLHRWLSHLCAPTFVFLAGVSLALGIDKAPPADTPRAVDRHLLARGAILVGCDLVVISWIWGSPSVRFFFQVLYAIGGGMILMVGLRRLSPAVLAGVGLALVVGGEALTGLVLFALGTSPGEAGAGARLPEVVTFLLTGGRQSDLGMMVAYPILPWLGTMLLGWSVAPVFRRGPAAARFFAGAGAGGLLIFLVVRGLNSYGNFALLREGHSLVQWLHVSKYPPSLAFSALELGLMALLLAAFLCYQERARRPPNDRNPLLVFGQVPLFFYLLHIPLLEAAGAVTAMESVTLGPTYVAVIAVLVLLYPACLAYRVYKRAHPYGLARYI